MDTSPVSSNEAQFLAATIQGPTAIPVMPPLDAFALPNSLNSMNPMNPMKVPMLAPVPYMPAALPVFNDYQPQYPMMDQAVDLDVPRPPLQMQPPSAAIHGLGASYNINNTSSLASALDPGAATLPLFLPTAPVVSFDEHAQVKQEEVQERVVGNMLKSIAQVIKSAGDACHQHQATRPITPGDEQRTRQVIAQITDLIQGMGLPTNSSVDVSRKRQAGDLKDVEQPVKKALKPEPEEVSLSTLPPAPVTPPFMRAHTVSRSQPSSRPPTPPLTVKPVPTSFRPPPFPTTPALWDLFLATPTLTALALLLQGRMGRSGYFIAEHGGWTTKGISPKSAPTLATFTYPGSTAEPMPPVCVPCTTDAVEEEDEDNDVDADDNDNASPSGLQHNYSEGPPLGSEIPQEYRAEVDRVFLEFLSRICSNLDAADNKGDPIHQQLMPKKMQKLDESTDFRPFKFRIQAFTAAFLEALAEQGYPEEKIPMKKVRNFLWRQPLILRFNEDGKKAKSKGNHIWNVEAKKLGEGSWEFRPFHRKIAGNPPAWKDAVLFGTPPPSAESCDITTIAKFNLDGHEGQLTHTFFLTIAPLASADNPFATAFAQRPSTTPRRSVSDSTILSRSIPRTPASLITDEEDEARVKMVLEGVANKLKQQPQSSGYSSELSRQKHVLEKTVTACDYEHSGNAPEGSHELAVAGQNVVAEAAQCILRSAALPGGTLILPNNASAMQNVATDSLINTTKDAIAEAVSESRGTSDIDELSILLVACRVLSRWPEHSPPTVHMQPPPEWYVPTYV
ncbi:hypothetical protein C8J57DRAFT_1715557 [Mycena rebaudengoi]|nr:hypothetical protein C8J57DRAFT_1715557 [Mycena rebaudengoi]